jgi:polysaccharide biosynthesis protein PslJ
MSVNGRRHTRTEATDLPAWPLLVALVGFPIWWLVGVVDVIWIIVGLVMLALLGRARNVAVPRGFGVWLLFLVLVLCSAINLDEPGALLLWAYRFLMYASAGVVAVYVYNARRHVTHPVIVGGMIALWVTTVAGGYLGVLFPAAQLETPLAYVTPQGLLGNDLVRDMVVLRFSQYNPNSYFDLAPRPSAPYNYTNNWGQMFSLLTPFLVVGLAMWRGKRWTWLLAVALPIGLVPAFLTLNRGMFIGLGLAATIIAIRQAVRGNARALLTIAALVVVAASVFTVLPTGDLLANRLEDSTTTQDRASLYQQAIDAAEQSPFFGHGAPTDADDPSLPPVGTQGQLWMVLVSHGPLALFCFLGWIFMAWLRSLPRHELVVMVANAALLVTLVQVFFYGLLPHGLPVVAVLIAVALRRELPAAEPADAAPVATPAATRAT